MPTHHIHTQLPPQKISRSAKDEDWQEKCMDALIGLSEFDRVTSPTRGLLHKLYLYYNGVIDEEDYAYVLKPYGTARRNYPAKLQNYPLIKPIVDLLLGEKRKRPLNHSVVAANADVITEREEEALRVIEENLQQHFVNEAAKLGVEVPEGAVDPEAPAPEEVQEEFELTYKDRRSIAGQRAIDYIVYEQEIRRKLLKAWKHWLISGRVATRRGFSNGNLTYEVLDPTHVDFAKSPDIDFIEDAMWATLYIPMVPSDVIDEFHDVLTDEEIDQIESPYRPGSTQIFTHASKEGTQKARLIEVIYGEWKSMKKIYFVTYLDELGELQERVEPENYIEKEGDLHHEAAWVTEVWEGYRIDGDIYKRIRPQQHLRKDLENPSEAKLSINGRTYSDLNAPPVSLVMLGIPYQLKYNIFWFRLENAIAKSKDVITVFDLNLIPPGWDPEKFMHYMDAMGIAFVDYNAEGVKLNPQHQSVLDMSIKVIADYISLLEAIRTEWEWVSGVNRQRQGQIGQYDGKGTTEQGIIQSSHITEDLFGLFAELEERDLQALLDFSKYSWIEGKQSTYLTEDMRQMYLSLDGIEHMESEYGVFVSDAAKDREKKAMIEQLGQSMLQNGASISTVIDIIDSSNFSQIKEKVQQAERSQQKLEQEMQQMQMQQLQAEAELEREKMDRDDRNQQLDRDTQIDIAMLKSATEEDAGEAERLKDDRDREKLQIERDSEAATKRIEEKKLALENKKLQVEARLKEKEINVKKQQSKDKK